VTDEPRGEQELVARSTVATVATVARFQHVERSATEELAAAGTPRAVVTR
jgi:hypothetical protein